MSWMDDSDEEFINNMVNETLAKEEAAKGINQKSKCDECKREIVHRTCKSCNKTRCKDCTTHWQCPGCDEYFCEVECCKTGGGGSSSSSDNGLYWCDGCGVICNKCLPWLYEDFTLMDSCCDKYCKKEIPKHYHNLKG